MVAASKVAASKNARPVKAKVKKVITVSHPPPVGSVIRTLYDDGCWYRGVVTESTDEASCEVRYDDGDTETVKFPAKDFEIVSEPTSREQSVAKGKKGKGKKRKAEPDDWGDDKPRANAAVRSRPFWALPDTLILNAFSVPSRFCSKTGWKSDGWRRYAAWNGTAKTVGEALELGATQADIGYHARLGNITLVDVSSETAEENAQRARDVQAEHERLMATTWMAVRRRAVVEGTDLATIKGSVEDVAKRGKMVNALGELHRDAGLRGFRRGTSAMPNFLLMSAAGDTIHSTSHEAHEQLVATWALRSDDCVLEVGGGIGAVSSMVQEILRDRATDDKSPDHAVVEAQETLCEVLAANKKLHASKFSVHQGALSKSPIFSCVKTLLDGPNSKNKREWMFNATTSVKGENQLKVPSLKPATLRKGKSRDFTALIVDCEGAFPGIVKDFPEILDGIRVIYLEQDGDAADFKECEKSMVKRGFRCVLCASKHRVYYLCN